MLDEILRGIFTNQWLVFGFAGVVLLAAAELGFRFGLRLHRTKDEARKGQIGGIQGAMLGLLGLLFGFTFAMAVGRNESRRSLVLAVGACGCCACGYSAGSTGARSNFTNVALPMLIAVAITLIADLDRSRGGLIGINQQPMLDLKQSLQVGSH